MCLTHISLLHVYPQNGSNLLHIVNTHAEYTQLSATAGLCIIIGDGHFLLVDTVNNDGDFVIGLLNGTGSGSHLIIAIVVLRIRSSALDDDLGNLLVRSDGHRILGIHPDSIAIRIVLRRIVTIILVEAYLNSIKGDGSGIHTAIGAFAVGLRHYHSGIGTCESIVFRGSIGSFFLFTSAFTFIYSKRSGTPAAKMDNQVPLPVKKERLNRLMALQNENSLREHEKLIGKTVEVLAEGPSKQADVWTGRSRTGVLVLWPVEGKEYAVGQKVNVVIDTAQTWLVKGKALD